MGAAMSNITVTQEEIEAWMRDIRLLSAHLSHPRDAEPVLPFDIGSRSEMRERLLKLSSLLKVMGCGLGPIRISSPCVPNAELKQEYILEILSGIIDEFEDAHTDSKNMWKQDFLNELKIPIEFKKMLGYDEE